MRDWAWYPCDWEEALKGQQHDKQLHIITLAYAYEPCYAQASTLKGTQATTPEELSDLNDEFEIITIKLDEDGDPYIAPGLYFGYVDVSSNQGVRMLQSHSGERIEQAIETLHEILKFKVKFPHS